MIFRLNKLAQLYHKLRLLVLVSVFVFSTPSYFAQTETPDKPLPERLVNNLSKQFPNFISTSEAEQLENKLQTFSKETSNQICIVIVDSLNGLSDNEFATQILNKWGIGKQKVNNGVVILIKPTGGKGQRALFITVGYGLEGAIPDLATKKIRETDMYPYLANGDNYTALDKATTTLMQLAKGEINVKDYAKKSKRDTWLTVLFIIGIIIFIIIRSQGGGRNNGGGMIFTSGGFGGFSSGGSWGNSSSGSGSSWGGFGGGSSGGGGSGGNW